MGNIMYDVTDAYAHKVITDPPELANRTIRVYNTESTALNPLQPNDEMFPRKMRSFTDIIYVDNAYLTFLSDTPFNITPAYHSPNLPDVDPNTGIAPNPNDYPHYIEYSLDREHWIVIASKAQTPRSKREHIYNPDFDSSQPSTSENPKFIEDEDGKYAIYMRGKMWDKCIFNDYITDSNDIPTDNWKIVDGTNVAIIGNFQTLIDCDDPPDEIGDFSAIAMFDRQKSITDISKLRLPATKLGEDCYGLMFTNCSGLVDISGFRLDAPEIGLWSCESMFGGCDKLKKLPIITSTSIKEGGFYSMFMACTELENIDDWALPITKLDDYCFESMFTQCDELVSAKIIMPADQMYESSCKMMFSRCKKLVNLPELPATKMGYGCYEQMFTYCAATVLPELKSVELDDGCYYGMYWRSSELTDISELELPATILKSKCYGSMFQECEKLVNASLLLDADVVVNRAYHSMFESCTNLTEVPTINATTCYDGGMRAMFFDCINLVTPPALNITTLPNLTFTTPAPNQFQATPAMAYMFAGCTKLTSIPDLPCTSMGTSLGCYENMFEDCTSLVDLSENVLPATTVSFSCYSRMFKGCTALEHPPSMPTTSYAYTVPNQLSGTITYPPNPDIEVPFMPSCYEMFANCTSLVDTPELPATTTGTGCFSHMFLGCTALVQTMTNLLSNYIINYAYESMFEGCTALEVAPIVNAAIVAGHGCYRMLFGCTSLLNGAGMLDNLGLTDSYINAFESMFEGCSSLLTIPNLKPNFLRQYQYYRMFANCRDLEIVTAPNPRASVEWKIPFTGRLSSSQTKPLSGNQVTDMFLNISGNAPNTPLVNFALTSEETEESNPLVKYYQRPVE